MPAARPPGWRCRAVPIGPLPVLLRRGATRKGDAGQVGARAARSLVAGETDHEAGENRSVPMDPAGALPHNPR